VTYYSIELSKEQASKDVSIKFTTVLTSFLEPYPAEITQAEAQLVRFTDSHYFLSPYSTETQKTTIKLASSSIESYTKKSPHSVRGSTITYGPYPEIEPLETSPATVHFVNNRPFAKFSTMQREVEVSHWGNVAVEELYELKHAGAKLTGGFSRFDFQMKQQRPGATPSFRGLVATLPGQASNIYYRDQIGNISTSDLKVIHDNNKKFVEMEIQTRFPMFGGWQTQFYLGYTVPTETMLFIDPQTGRHALKFDFYTPFDDVWVEDMEIKVVLPEGCKDIKVDVPYPVQQSSSRRFTYLDSDLNGGRPVITLKTNNIVSEHDKQVRCLCFCVFCLSVHSHTHTFTHTHTLSLSLSNKKIKKVVISYSFERNRMIVEPLMLCASFFVFFCICSVISRVGGGATADESSKLAKKETTAATVAAGAAASTTAAAGAEMKK